MSPEVVHSQKMQMNILILVTWPVQSNSLADLMKFEVDLFACLFNEGVEFRVGSYNSLPAIIRAIYQGIIA